ncbi:hypothetical protein CO705_19155 [Ralstonia pickettii]|nr:hypothetical protein CO705_19155 [Ralstonia pickettii]
MQDHTFTEAQIACLLQLEEAVKEALPSHAVVRVESSEVGSNVYAWWIVHAHPGVSRVNSFSFQLSPQMLQAYFHQSTDDRARTLKRLRDWTRWTLDGDDCTPEDALGFDVSAFVPRWVFLADATELQR